MFEVLLTNNDANIINLNQLKEYIIEEMHYLDKTIQCHIKDMYNQEKAIAMLSVANIVDKRSWEREKILYPIANGITNYMIEVKQKDILYSLLKFEVFLSKTEKMEILKYVEPLSEVEQSYFYNQIYSAIITYFETDSTLNVDGFFRFRLKEFYELLENMLEKAIDKYMYQQEQQEFIELLRYFVSIQDTSIDIVHVMYYGENNYQLLDQDYKLIKMQLEEQMENVELDDDDFLVSFLITLSPAHIVFHNHNQENTYLFEMMGQIFTEKLQFCNSWQLCITDLVQKT